MLFSSSIKAAADSYPYPNASECPDCEVDPWYFYKRQCTSYAAWKINESGLKFSNSMKGPNGEFGKFGNAENWDNNAENIGFTVSSTPRQGSIAVWDAGDGGTGAAGHVAYVESINSNGTVNVSEYNWNYGDGKYNTRSGVDPSHFIYFTDEPANNSCGGSNVRIENTNIKSGQSYSCSASESITLLPSTTIQNGSNTIFFIK